jgi:hypothetical protein
MDTRLNPRIEHTQAQPGTLAVRLFVWGENDADQEHAIRKAGYGGGRTRWQFVTIERHSGTESPIYIEDPKTIAAEAGPRWAYAVYPAEATR